MNEIEKILIIVLEIYIVLGGSFILFCIIQGLVYKISKHKINIYKNINNFIDKIVKI